MMERQVLLVPELDGQFTAILEGDSLCVTARTREEAMDRLRYRAERILRGEAEHAVLDLPDMPRGGLPSLVGTSADDPDLGDIVEAAYAERDAAPYGGF